VSGLERPENIMREAIEKVLAAMRKDYIRWSGPERSKIKDEMIDEYCYGLEVPEPFVETIFQ